MDIPKTKSPVTPLPPAYRQLEPARLQQPSLSLSEGQMLKATVTGQSTASQYTLGFGDHQLEAQSSLPLRIGQQLELQVITTNPQTELQIIADPVGNKISGSLFLLNQQQSLAASLGRLTQSEQFNALSKSSQQTLSQFQQTLSPVMDQLVSAGSSPVQAMVQSIFSSPQPVTLAASSVHPVVQQLNAALPAESPLSSGLEQMQSTLTSSTSIALTTTQTDAAIQLTKLQELVASMPSSNSSGSELVSQALTFFSDSPGLFPTKELLLLLEAHISVTTATTSENTARETIDPRQLANRLGLDMEQLFADGNKERAIQTLKFALLELNQQLGHDAAKKHEAVSSQSLQTVELYQMLQLRFSGESLFFMPLPFSFLEQGYLLVDQENSAQQESGQSDGSNQRYSLHLCLEGLGNLQINVQQEEEQVTIQFYSEDHEKMNFLRENSEELRKRLASMENLSLQFFADNKDPVHHIIATLFQGGSGLVNTEA